jgi:hypothetical protein
MHLTASAQDAAGTWGDEFCGNEKPFACEADSFLPPYPAGCSPGAGFAGSSYLLCDVDDWADAQLTCADAFGLLAVIDTAAELAHVVDALAIAFPAEDETWVGASDATVEGTWRWVTGDVLYSPSFSAWDDAEPNGGGTQACLALDGNPLSAVWRDLGCSSALGFICDTDGILPPLPPACAVHDAGNGVRVVCDEPMSFADAQAFCVTLGGALVHVLDGVDNENLAAAALSSSPGARWWIGGTDSPFEDFWTWLDDGSLIDAF